MMKLSPKMMVVFTAVAAALVVVVAAVVLVVPMFGRLSNLDSQVQQSQGSLDQAKALLQQRQASRDEAAATDAALLQLVAAVPENPDLPSFIIELQDLAYDSNVHITSIQPANLAAGSGWLEIPLQVKISGSWADTVDFVQRLHGLTRQVRIRKVESSGVAAGGTQNSAVPVAVSEIGTTIDLSTYIIPSASNTASGTPNPQTAPQQ